MYYFISDDSALVDELSRKKGSAPKVAANLSEMVDSLVKDQMSVVTPELAKALEEFSFLGDFKRLEATEKVQKDREEQGIELLRRIVYGNVFDSQEDDDTLNSGHGSDNEI